MLTFNKQERAEKIYKIKNKLEIRVTVEPVKKPTKFSNRGKEHSANYRGCKLATTLQKYRDQLKIKNS